MSDNFRILGVGGAGVNTVKALGYRNSVFIDSNAFDSLKAISDIVERGGKDDKIVIVSSPAGDFSSSVLRSICNVFNSNGNRVFLVGIMPFLSESPERKRRGELLLKELKKVVDSIVVVENENFASSMMEHSWIEVLGKINDYVGNMVKSFVSSNDETEAVKSMESLPSEGSLGYAPNVTISPN